MSSALLPTLALMVGLFLLLRDAIFGGIARARTEEEEHFKHLLEHGDDLGELPEETRREREMRRKKSLSERLAGVIGSSELFRGDEGKTFLERLDLSLVRAGIRETTTPEQALAKAMLIWAFGIGMPILLVLIGGIPKLVAALAIIVFLLYPPLKLRSMVGARQDSIRGELPLFILDLYMALSANLTIDRAIVRIARTADEDPYESILSREFYIAQVEYSVGGKSMEDALRGVSHRTGVVSVDNLVEALVQGIRTGSSLDKVLLEYSTQARETWRQDTRTYKNKKQTPITLFVVVTMLGAAILLATPIFVQVLESLQMIGS